MQQIARKGKTIIKKRYISIRCSPFSPCRLKWSGKKRFCRFWSSSYGLKTCQILIWSIESVTCGVYHYHKMPPQCKANFSFYPGITNGRNWSLIFNWYYITPYQLIILLVLIIDNNYLNSIDYTYIYIYIYNRYIYIYIYIYK